MPLPSSGQLSFSQIRTEHGGSGAVAMNNYYQGGSVVAFSPENVNIPTSGQISVSNFYSSDGYGSGTGIVIVPASTGGKLPSIGYDNCRAVGGALGSVSQSSCMVGSSKATFSSMYTGLGFVSNDVLAYGASAGSSTILQGKNVTIKTSSFSGPTLCYTTAGYGTAPSYTATCGYYNGKTKYSFAGLLKASGPDMSVGTTYYCSFA